MEFDRELAFLVGGILFTLVVATIAGQVLKRRVHSESGIATVVNLNQRIAAWWGMCVVFGIAILTAGIGSVVLFGIISFLALREFVTLTFTKRGDHRAYVSAWDEKGNTLYSLNLHKGLRAFGFKIKYIR